MQNDYDPDPGDTTTFQGITTQPQHGALNPNNVGIYNYVPIYGYLGPDSFTYSICDSHGACATGTVNISVVNQAPVANTDSYTVHASRVIYPAQNDTDPDGDSITFQAIATQPQHGWLSGIAQGGYSYISYGGGYVGSDSFTYTIKDSLGLFATGTVNIELVNQAPVANPDFYVLHAPLLIYPKQNDIDPDNDMTTFQAIATQPAHGWLSPYAQGAYTYQPYGGYTGSDTFTYTIVDSLGAVSTGTVYLFLFSQAAAAALPPHSCACPVDPGKKSSFTPTLGGLVQFIGGVTGLFGSSAGDPVNLATGRESEVPAPDLSVYNPTGPPVTWQRSYISNQALAETTGYGSPGLSRGWMHNYDLRIQGTTGSWGALKLFYPNGAMETLTPQLSGGQPTGSFTTVAGAPYRVAGISGSPTGTWQSVTVTWKDQTKWKFTVLSGTTYALTQITNRTGQSLNLTWNSSRALTQVTDAGTSAVLLTLGYDTKGRILTATDMYGRQVAYTFSTGTATSPIMLQTVSQVVSSGTANPPAHWTYTYTTDNGQQLNSVTVPSPTGSGNSTATINYDSMGRVASLVDANGNQRVYTYNSGSTQVQVKDSASNVALSWIQKFNTGGLDTGITDTASHSTTNAYTDAANPLKPTSVTDRNGHTTTFTYDTFGNVLTLTPPRGLTTTYTWSYANFALGRLTSVQEGSKPATTLTYYEPSGLVQTVTRPEPNDGAGTTTTSYSYDSLGNVLTVVAPGNDAAATITTTLNYTTDGAYSQSAKRSQPLTVTDNLNHVTHLRYDSQGRATSVTDALGNETDFSYNLIGQPDTTTYPATGQTGSGHSHTTNAYLYVGGPLTTITALTRATPKCGKSVAAMDLKASRFLSPAAPSR
jgi:YD repeat-containing protein